MAWHDGDAAQEELSERTLSLEVQVHSELVQHVDVSDASERGCLEGACGVEIDEALLYVPRCDWSTIMPVVTTVQSKTKISCCTREVCRVSIAQICCSTCGTARVAEEAVAGSHPVNILQYRGALVDTGACGRSLTAEWVLYEKVVVDVTHYVPIPGVAGSGERA